MIVGQALIAVALAVATLAVAPRVHAQRAPTEVEWSAAESVLDAYYERRHERPRQIERSPWGGTMFITSTGTVAVRGRRVIDGSEVRGEAFARAVLRADHLFASRSWSAAGLVGLLACAGRCAVIPRNERFDPGVTAVAAQAGPDDCGGRFAPRVVYGRTVVRVTAYLFRDGARSESCDVRAIEWTIDASYRITAAGGMAGP